MHRNKYYSSKIPLALVLLFLLNVFFVVCGELLLVYKYPAELTEASLAQYDPAWAGSKILSKDNYSTSLNCCVAELPDGSPILITVKPHSIAFGRAKLLDVQPLDPAINEQIFHVRHGALSAHSSEIAVFWGSTAEIRWGYGGGFQQATTFYMVLAAVLEALELGIYHLIKSDEE